MDLGFSQQKAGFRADYPRCRDFGLTVKRGSSHRIMDTAPHPHRSIRVRPVMTAVRES